MNDGNKPILLYLICTDCGRDWKGFFPYGREFGEAECPSCGKMTGVIDTIEERYRQLIYCIDQKYEKESRHMTALRVIKRNSDCLKVGEIKRIDKEDAPPI